jgi:hypothetical protein
MLCSSNDVHWMEEGSSMEDTRAFVNKFKDTQAKQRKNRNKGHGTPSAQLPTKQHANNP